MNGRFLKTVLGVLPGLMFVFPSSVSAVPPEEIPELPELLRTAAGRDIWGERDWRVYREELVEVFRREIYGRAPVGRPPGLEFRVDGPRPTRSGDGEISVVEISFDTPRGRFSAPLNVILPAGIRRPAPVFLLICNRGRELIDPDREEWDGFWPVDLLLSRGWGAAAFQVSDFDPDSPDGYADGVRARFDPASGPAADAWGTIAAWAWGASRAMDYFETVTKIDTSRIAVVGHSRGGKAALWAGAEDQRFAFVVSNNSGCTGAALARRRSGELVKQINDRFPHWFNANYKRYNDREEDLPVDQHQLIALMAPRPVYVASASEDAWADPIGEFLAARFASPAYGLYGLPGLIEDGFPAPGRVYHDGRIGYHLREGRHNLTRYDWMRFLDFVQRHWRGE